MNAIREKSVTIITPSIGNDHIGQCIKSVKGQTYKEIKHLIVADGPNIIDRIEKYIELCNDNPKLQITSTPENTGISRYYGHRIYAAYPHLVNSEYIVFLDEDNWLQPNHVETLVDQIMKNNLHFSYSLRQIYKEDGSYLDDDNCESLGKWPIFLSEPNNPQYLIDTSTYCFKRDYLIKFCHFWHYGWGGDRNFLYNAVLRENKHEKWKTTGVHTLCYRLGSDEKVKQMYGGYEFFEKGNSVMREKYGDNLPWLET